MEFDSIWYVLITLLLIVGGGWALLSFKGQKDKRSQPNLAARFSGVRADPAAGSRRSSQKPVASKAATSGLSPTDDDALSQLDHATASLSTGSLKPKPAANASESELLSEAEEVVVVTLLPKQLVTFSGSDVLSVLGAYGLKFGHMNLFHETIDEVYHYSIMRYQAGESTDGFDLQSLPDETVDGLTFILPLPHPHAVRAAEVMLTQAASMARDLSASLNSEDLMVLSRADRDALMAKARQYD